METNHLQGAPELPGTSTKSPESTPGTVGSPDQPAELVLEQPTSTDRSATRFKPLTNVRPHAPGEESDEDSLNEHVDYPGDPDGVVAAEERQQWEAKNPVSSAPQTSRPHRKHRVLVTFLVLVVLAGAAYGAYWFGNRQADKNSPQQSQSHTQKQQTTTHSTASQQTAAVPTKHYDSATYTLGIDYPQDWTITDTAAKLTVVSPALSLQTVGGSTVNGHVVATIQNKQTAIAGYPADGAVAVLESQKLTYKQPTPVQRAQTYLSYLQYSKANGLDALYVTGDYGYQQGQNIPMSNVVQGNPLISVTFQSCTSTDCSTGTPTMLTLLASKWSNLQASKQITDLLQSITLD